MPAQLALYRNRRAWYEEIADASGWLAIARRASEEGYSGIAGLALRTARLRQEQALRYANSPDEFGAALELSARIDEAARMVRG